MLAAVVLAGGQSRRMGRDKATMELPGSDGLTMVEHTVSVLASRCEPVFVVAAAGQWLPPLPAAVLVDEVPGLGPLPATGLGLRAAAEAGAARAFVSAVDMPNLCGGLVDLLAGFAGPDLESPDLVLPFDGRDHYLAAVYRTALAGRIEELVAAGHRRMRAVAEAVAVQRVVLDPASARALTNFNEPI